MSETRAETIKKQEELEINTILATQQRTSCVEEGRFVHSIKTPPIPPFSYPKPRPRYQNPNV